MEPTLEEVITSYQRERQKYPKEDALKVLHYSIHVDYLIFLEDRLSV